MWEFFLPQTNCLLCIREVMVKKYYHECKKASVTAQNVLNFWDFLIENNPIKMFCECAFAMACTLLNIISFPPVTDCIALGKLCNLSVPQFTYF